MSIFSLLPLTLNAQMTAGSVAVLQSAGDYIAVAADSKGLSRKGVSLNRCKIVTLDDGLVFAATGYTNKAGVPKSPSAWEASDIAKEHYHLLLKTPRHELIRKLAEAYGADLAARLEPDVKTHPEERWPSLLADALFAGFDENQKRVIIQVTVSQKAFNGVTLGVGYFIKPWPADDEAYAVVIGETAIAREYAAGNSQRSRSWISGMALQAAGLPMKERLILATAKIVELTREYDPAFVGGPIDEVLVSRKTGATWVRHKMECGTTESGH